MKTLLAGVSLVLAVNAAATTLALNWLRVELAPGWVHSIEETAPVGSDFGDRIGIRRPDGVGVLRLQAYTAPAPITDEALRRLTNVPNAQSLVKGQWGDFSGYRHDYLESGLFHRAWWLARDDQAVFLNYECATDQRQVEIDQIEEIVQSLTSN
jgi:hypothetical protein